MIDRPRRPRGRPKGSEIDDGAMLAQIADLLVQDRARNVAAAVRLLARHDPSLIRRLQRKYRRDSGPLMVAAGRSGLAARERLGQPVLVLQGERVHELGGRVVLVAPVRRLGGAQDLLLPDPVLKRQALGPGARRGHEGARVAPVLAL